MSTPGQTPEGTKRLLQKDHGQNDDDSVKYTPSRIPKKSKMLSTEEAQSWAEAYRSSVDATYRTAQKIPTFDEIMFNPQQHFQYQPLDHDQPSIRLVHLLPNLSSEGLIQCKISHASTESPYVCLSYVWDVSRLQMEDCAQGDMDNRVILVNDQLFRIRSNLFDFLWIARHNATRRDWKLEKFDLSIPFWIDALCINQLNVLERNHQVEQMGAIYSHALRVHVWLGIAPPLETDRYNASGTKSLVYQNRTAHVESVLSHWCTCEPLVGQPSRPHDRNYALVLGCSILQNKFWTRAWVIQEIHLARELTFWLHTFPLSMEAVRKVKMNTLSNYVSYAARQIRCEHYDDHCSITLDTRDRPDILTLLDRFANKKCADPRDRVFSLLSVCSSGAIPIPVDYACSLNLLAYRVLSHAPERLCLCTIAVVLDAVGVDSYASITSQRLFTVDRGSKSTHHEVVSNLSMAYR